MQSYLFVFLGGGLGSIFRFLIAQLLRNYNLHFPWATFTANVVSCVILGALVGLSLRGEMSNHWRLFLMTGFCGGFSTFSTFTNETYQLLLNGNSAYAFSNVTLSLLICLFCIYLGIKLTA